MLNHSSVVSIKYSFFEMKQEEKEKSCKSACA
jgi:hypothetical protein